MARHLRSRLGRTGARRTGVLTGLLGALLLLALPASAATAAAARAPAAGGHPAGRPSAGCGADPGQAPGTTERHTLTSGGATREYLVHLPAGYQPHRPLPLVLAFHGQGRDGAYMEELTGFDALDAVAVYPTGAPGTEDGQTAWQGAPYSAPGVDDVAFTGDLIDRLEHDLCVDPRQVHAAGKSNGGGFTALLACRMPGRIASFSIASGAFYPQAGPCRPRRPAPLLTFHGGADTTIPYGGNPAKGLPAVPDWLAERARLAGCSADSRDTDLGDGVTRRAWHGCAGRGALVHYRVDSLAHDWPSTRPNPDSDVPSVLDATPLMWHFMRTHPLHRA